MKFIHKVGDNKRLVNFDLIHTLYSILELFPWIFRKITISQISVEASFLKLMRKFRDNKRQVKFDFRLYHFFQSRDLLLKSKFFKDFCTIETPNNYTIDINMPALFLITDREWWFVKINLSPLTVNEQRVFTKLYDKWENEVTSYSVDQQMNNWRKNKRRNKATGNLYRQWKLSIKWTPFANFVCLWLLFNANSAIYFIYIMARMS